MIQRDDLPETPDWRFTPHNIQPGTSLTMPHLWQDDGDQN